MMQSRLLKEVKVATSHMQRLNVAPTQTVFRTNLVGGRNCAVAANHHLAYPVSNSGCSNARAAGFVASLSAGIILALAVPDASLANIEYAIPTDPVGEVQMQRLESQYDDNLQTKELREFLALLEKGDSLNIRDLEAARLKVGFSRGADGRVALKSKSGRWYDIKADMQSPGFLLAREQRSGECFALPPDDGGRLLQVDLSDDMVVAQLFGSGAWEDVMEPLRAEDMSGRVAPLRLSAPEFRHVMSLLEDSVDQQEGGAQ